MIVGPLPPPVSGNSLPVEALASSLGSQGSVTVVNTNRRQHGSGTLSLVRVRELLAVARQVRRSHARHDVVYLTIAESRLGILRDLALLSLLRQRRASVVVHLFGGSGLKRFLAAERSPLRRAYVRTLADVGAILVEGEMQRRMLQAAIPGPPVVVVNNYADPALRASEEELARKRASRVPLRVLFLSNMLPGKGHIELLRACVLLQRTHAGRIHVDFAGRAPTGPDAREFDRLVRSLPDVTYHGSVHAEQRRDLFVGAHVFCLPTYYAYEGQPFSILEAYGAGACVITTAHAGIPDIFADGINGCFVAPRDPFSIAAALARAGDGSLDHARIGRDNWQAAGERFARERFLRQLESALDAHRDTAQVD